MQIDKRSRAALLDQQPAVLWFTGLSGAGKSTIANHLESLLHRDGYKTMLLDGDILRLGLNGDLGFSKTDRIENIRRVSEVAKLLTEAGLIVIVALISPFQSERQRARNLMAPGEFIEIFVDTPIKECIRRDPKGLYRRALAGELENMIGLDAPYETPENPDLHLQTEHADPMVLARQILTFLKAASG